MPKSSSIEQSRVSEAIWNIERGLVADQKLDGFDASKRSVHCCSAVCAAVLIAQESGFVSDVIDHQ